MNNPSGKACTSKGSADSRFKHLSSPLREHQQRQRCRISPLSKFTFLRPFPPWRRQIWLARSWPWSFSFITTWTLKAWFKSSPSKKYQGALSLTKPLSVLVAEEHRAILAAGTGSRHTQVNKYTRFREVCLPKKKVKEKKKRKKRFT